MKVLLDENLDRRLRTSIGAHDVLTVAYKGWQGLRNGKLIELAELDGFDVLLTAIRACPMSKI